MRVDARTELRKLTEFMHEDRTKVGDGAGPVWKWRWPGSRNSFVPSGLYTNGVHCSACEFTRNTDLNASQFFQNAKRPGKHLRFRAPVSK